MSRRRSFDDGIVYYPHASGDRFRYRKSARPNDASEWTAETQVGYSVTDPKFFCGPDNTLFLSARATDVNPPVARLCTKAPGGSWTMLRTLLRADVSGYASFGEMFAWSPDRQTLHMACRFYND